MKFIKRFTVGLLFTVLTLCAIFGIAYLLSQFNFDFRYILFPVVGIGFIHQIYQIGKEIVG